MIRLRHGRLSIALHPMKEGSGAPLLLLHELGSAATSWPQGWEGWPGPVHALDFAGHGASDRIRGGGYYPEFFLADADLALEAVGDRAAVAGAGIGAYVALLLAGARPDRVPATLLLPGRGLAGGGAVPDFAKRGDDADTWQQRQAELAAGYAKNTDPRVSRCEQDLRPLDYVRSFAGHARQLLFSLGVDPSVGAPPWWREAQGTAVQEDAPREFAAGIESLERAAALQQA